MLCHYLLKDFAICESVEDLKSVMQKAKETIGFNNYSMLFIPFQKSHSGLLYTYNTKALIQKLDFNNLQHLSDNQALIADSSEKILNFSPLFRCAFTTLNRFPWNTSEIRNHDDFVSLMSEHSIHGGLSIPYLCGNKHLCLLDFYFDHEITDNDARMYGELIWLGQVMHARVIQLLQPDRLTTNIELIDDECIADLLTERQYQVVELLCDGGNNKTIATTCRISENMVQRHISKSMKILKCNNRTELSFRFKKGTNSKDSTTQEEQQDENEIIFFGHKL
jgi:DNA-binding CsgD family transcriptional regulator